MQHWDLPVAVFTGIRRSASHNPTFRLDWKCIDWQSLGSWMVKVNSPPSRPETGNKILGETTAIPSPKSFDVDRATLSRPIIPYSYGVYRASGLARRLRLMDAFGGNPIF